jgi:hypothetical protein
VEAPALYLPDGDGFVGTILTQGGWDPGAQNGAVVLALLGHRLEDVPTLAPMGLARLTVDLVRPVPIGVRLDVRVDVVREGKKIQVVLLELVAGDVLHVRATALRLRVDDLGPDGVELLGPPPGLDDVLVLPPPESCLRVGQHEGAPGFLRGIEMRKCPGQGVWIRLAVPVVAGEPVRDTSRMTVNFDFAQLVNAAVERAMPVMTMINPDVTAHVLRPPTGDWTAVTGTTMFAPAVGRGMSSAVLADESGPYAIASTTQLVQPR